MRTTIATRSLVGLILLLQSACFAANAGEPPAQQAAHRVVFLGDSITYSGRFIDLVESFLRARNPALACSFLNLGLPSETVSGLSEPGHAGGQFPRPVLRDASTACSSRRSRTSWWPATA